MRAIFVLLLLATACCSKTVAPEPAIVSVKTATVATSSTSTVP